MRNGEAFLCSDESVETETVANNKSVCRKPAASQEISWNGSLSFCVRSLVDKYLWKILRFDVTCCSQSVGRYRSSSNAHNYMTESVLFSQVCCDLWPLTPGVHALRHTHTLSFSHEPFLWLITPDTEGGVCVVGEEVGRRGGGAWERGRGRCSTATLALSGQTKEKVERKKEWKESDWFLGWWVQPCFQIYHNSALLYSLVSKAVCKCLHGR